MIGAETDREWIPSDDYGVAWQWQINSETSTKETEYKEGMIILQEGCNPIRRWGTNTSPSLANMLQMGDMRSCTVLHLIRVASLIVLLPRPLREYLWFIRRNCLIFDFNTLIGRKMQVAKRILQSWGNPTHGRWDERLPNSVDQTSSSTSPRALWLKLPDASERAKMSCTSISHRSKNTALHIYLMLSAISIVGFIALHDSQFENSPRGLFTKARSRENINVQVHGSHSFVYRQKV
jgi:hypothetical protein